MAASTLHSTEPESIHKCRIKTPVTTLLFLVAFVLIISAASILAVTIMRDRRSSVSQASKAIAQACRLTQYPDLCVRSLQAEFPGVTELKEVAHMSVNVTLRRLRSAMSKSVEIVNLEMDSMGRSAYEDCVELLDEAAELVRKSLVYFSSDDDQQGGDGPPSVNDVMTWLSAALTNQDTCTDGLTSISSTSKLKSQITEIFKDLSELVSNSLAIYTSIYADELSSVDNSQRQRRRLLTTHEGGDFPTWMSRQDRELLTTTNGVMQVDVVVAQDGSGMVKTITEAIKKAPKKSSRRFIIYIKAGRYEESNLKVSRKKTNLWFIGEGKGKTVITGDKNVARDKITTFHTATFASSGSGFVAKDITFTNYAGPNNHQAVALRISADHAVIYRCSITGYQDTLYVHSNRQFYRDCDIYGTVDFIFGNAAVVFQHCNIYSRKPLPQQKVTITAQNRKDPNQNTGMSIHACQLLIEPGSGDQVGGPVVNYYPTFLGRPWKAYARVVYMLSYFGGHVEPKGWVEWNSTVGVENVYYGEYMNGGPGADTSQRVKWAGLHLNMTSQEASKFTVAEFINGLSWLVPTGVAFQSGLG